MVPKITIKQEALKLRRLGKSYKEIGHMLEVPKSTLSYWLNKIELTNDQQLLILKKQIDGRIKGAKNRKNNRITKEKMIITKAANEITKISKRELWLLGIIAYWCEGAKQKNNNISSRVIFSNSDPLLIKLFVVWIEKVCNISKNRLIFTLYIHENGNLERGLQYWSKILEINKDSFGKTVFKKHKVSTNRKYDNKFYYGLLRVTVKSSTDLNRQIKGWAKGIDNILN